MTKATKATKAAAAAVGITTEADANATIIAAMVYLYRMVVELDFSALDNCQVYKFLFYATI